MPKNTKPRKRHIPKLLTPLIIPTGTLDEYRHSVFKAGTLVEITLGLGRCTKVDMELIGQLLNLGKTGVLTRPWIDNETKKTSTTDH